ncbi:hypothetical protein [Larkinella soli]|uniref:hypothetical protein n=1 Tax=Larkinella soli TaxID=1770527 RepID=UPI000FFCAED9|nr:hypothetical protein [Larkinella soli]
MKKNFFVVAFIVAGAGWISARPGDIVADLGLTLDQVKEVVATNVNSKDWQVDYDYRVRQLAKKIPEASRAGAVQAMGKVVRMYVESNDFKSRYQEDLKRKYNVSDEQTLQANQAASTTMGEVRNVYTQAVSSYSESMKPMTPEMLAMMIGSQIQVMEQEVAGLQGAEKTAKSKELAELKRIQALSKTKPEEFKKQYIANFDAMMTRQMNQGLVEAEDDLAKSKQDAEEYKKRLAEYKAAPSLNTVLKQRLTDFITLAESVDFNARLEKQGSTLEFVNPEYRNKPGYWKMLFRMGREPVMAARTFARQWLTDLQARK